MHAYIIIPFNFDTPLHAYACILRTAIYVRDYKVVKFKK